MVVKQQPSIRTLAYTALVVVCSSVLSLNVSAQEAKAKTAAAPAPAKAPEVAAKPEPKWEGTASIGATLTRGNSDTLLFTARLQGLRKWDQNEVNLGMDGTYGKSSGVKNNDSLRGYGQYNRLFTEKFYGYLHAELLHDDIADVQYRVNIGPGAGYYFVKDSRMLLSLEGGPSFVFEDAGGKNSSYMSARVAEKFEYKLTDRARIWQKAEYLPQIDDMANYILNFEVGVETDISKAFKLQVYVVDNYDNEPAAGRKKNDVKLVAAVAYKF